MFVLAISLYAILVFCAVALEICSTTPKLHQKAEVEEYQIVEQQDKICKVYFSKPFAETIPRKTECKNK